MKNVAYEIFSVLDRITQKRNKKNDKQMTFRSLMR
jgi:hypothetical protein